MACPRGPAGSGGFARRAGAPSSALLPMRGRSAPPPRVTFSPMRKSPKNLPEGISPLGTPLGGLLSSPQRRQAPLPPERGETPGSPQKPNLTAAPRIDSRGCDPRYSLRRNKDRFAHPLKVANRSLFVVQALSRGCGLPQGERSVPLRGIPKGTALGAPLVTFPATGKSPGCRAERLLWGCGGLWPPLRGAQRGSAPRIVKQSPAAKKVENTKGRNRMVPPFCREWAGKPGSVMMTIYLDRRSPGGSSHIDRWLSPQKARRAAALLLRSRCCFG